MINLENKEDNNIIKILLISSLLPLSIMIGVYFFWEENRENFIKDDYSQQENEIKEEVQTIYNYNYYYIEEKNKPIQAKKYEENKRYSKNMNHKYITNFNGSVREIYSLNNENRLLIFRDDSYNQYNVLINDNQLQNINYRINTENNFEVNCNLRNNKYISDCTIY